MLETFLTVFVGIMSLVVWIVCGAVTLICIERYNTLPSYILASLWVFMSLFFLVFLNSSDPKKEVLETPIKEVEHGSVDTWA